MVLSPCLDAGRPTITDVPHQWRTIAYRGLAHSLANYPVPRTNPRTLPSSRRWQRSSIAIASGNGNVLNMTLCDMTSSPHTIPTSHLAFYHPPSSDMGRDVILILYVCHCSVNE